MDKAIYLSSNDEKSSFIDSVDTFLFDMDGVLWHGNQLLDGVKECLAMIRSKVDLSLCLLRLTTYFIASRFTQFRS